MFMPEINVSTLGEFLRIVESAAAMLSCTAQELKDEYADYPICLLEYIENGVHENALEIRFDNECMAITSLFDGQGICDQSCISFDSPKDESSFIFYLVENYDYDYRKSVWKLPDCRLKAQETENKTIFCLMK